MEEFVDIPGYEGYKANRLGQVMGKCGKIMSPQTITDGYKRVQLKLPDGPKSMLVHRLIALTFIPNPDNKLYIDHIDKNTSNNCVDNLRWVTQSENCLNKYHRSSNTGEHLISFVQPKPTHTPAYYCSIKRDGIKIFSKKFKTLPEAITARDEVLSKL